MADIKADTTSQHQHRLIVTESEAPVVVVEEEKPPRETKRQRVASVDIFRGFTVAVISLLLLQTLQIGNYIRYTSQSSIKIIQYNLLDVYYATSR